MQMLGEQFVAATPQKVWAALNDPEVLRESIPGCQTLDQESNTRLTATVEVKVGPIGARFKGVVTLTDLSPPHSYTLVIEGNGGIAGSMKGVAKVSLTEADNGTLVKYDVEAQVGGRMAQLGGPIIDATAKQLSATFFSRFGEIVSGVKTAEPQPSTATVSVPASTSAAKSSEGSSFWAGFAMGLLLLLVALAAFEYGKHSAAPVIVLDSELLHDITEQLLQDQSTQGQEQ